MNNSQYQNNPQDQVSAKADKSKIIDDRICRLEQIIKQQQIHILKLDQQIQSLKRQIPNKD